MNARKRLALSLISLVPLAQPAAAQGIDWTRTKDRLQIDGWLRKLAEQCGQLGFTVLTPPDPNMMEKRIFSRLLLQSKYKADAEVSRWGGFVGEMQNLGKPDAGKSSAEKAGDALAAATVDPSSHDAAKMRYVEAFTDAFTPFLGACRSAAADPFVGANYLSGSGSLVKFEQEASDRFDEELRKVSK